jgi:predicted DNA-binding transcriptional regulator AlpA
MSGNKLLPRREVAKRYGVTVRTVQRWEADPELEFPKPAHINGRSYFPERELEDFDARCARRIISGHEKRKVGAPTPGNAASAAAEAA